MVKILKFFVVILTIFMTFTFCYGYLEEKEVISTVRELWERNSSPLINNGYQKELDIKNLKITNNFTPENKQDLLNIYYTVLNSGMTEFTFYCSNKYDNCLNDVEVINNDDVFLNEVNSVINVFNSFLHIKTVYSTIGKITVYVDRVYSESDINLITSKITSIKNDVIDTSLSDYDNIKNIHNYIINNTKYDDSTNNSNNAKGLLFNNKASCNGYTDTASIFFDLLNIKNIRIANSNHIWNMVYLDGKWLHIDLTWDDPVNNYNKDILTYDYFLKTDKEFDELNEKNINKHNYNKEMYANIINE